MVGGCWLFGRGWGRKHLHLCVDAELQPDQGLDAADERPGQQHRM